MKILSCGAGMQSTALALMSCENKIAAGNGHGTVHPLVPIYDAVIFCDLGMEPPWVMAQVHFIRRACESAGIHFKILDSPLYADFMKNFGERRTISIPWWTIKDDGHKSKMPRNCTIDYKVEVISKYVRWELLGYRKRWLAEQGVEMTSVTKDTITEALRDPDLPDIVRRVLEIRTALGKTSVAKYSTMLVAHCQDHRLRGILQFYGANRSGRWAGRLVQTHNLVKNTLPDLALARELAAEGDFETMGTLFGEMAFVFSELIRTAFIPSEGCRFVVSDFSAIEARVLAWIAGEEWTLEAFRQGKDIYCETASMMYHVPVEKHGANSHLRQKGKVAVLACGYQGGVGAMKRMDKGGTIPEDELQSVVDQWRGANPSVVKLWRNCEMAARTVIEEHRTVRLKNGIAFGYINGNLFIKLPSGRKLCYWNTHLKMDPRDGREHIVYMGVNQETKQWGETETYGGKLVENITQAIARDCLAISMQRVAALGYNIVMHVHDEMIVDVPIEDTDALERINACMGEAIPWAPGLPLRGDGYETPFYMKD